MGEKISIDSDEIREVAEEILPALADDYDIAISKAADATKNIGNAFGSGLIESFPREGVTISPPAENPLSAIWQEKYDFFYDCIYQSSTSIRATGKFLKKVADEYEILDSDLSNVFSEIMELVDSYEFRNDQVEEINEGRSDGNEIDVPPPPPESDDSGTSSSDQPLDPGEFA